MSVGNTKLLTGSLVEALADTVCLVYRVTSDEDCAFDTCLCGNGSLLPNHSRFFLTDLPPTLTTKYASYRIVQGFRDLPLDVSNIFGGTLSGHAATHADFFSADMLST